MSENLDKPYAADAHSTVDTAWHGAAFDWASVSLSIVVPIVVFNVPGALRDVAPYVLPPLVVPPIASVLHGSLIRRITRLCISVVLMLITIFLCTLLSLFVSGLEGIQ
ncbi:MAG: hypothetical protein KDA60_21310 [Planctomycetales bacterium]|nr:hypothetical protein [Planctomycetales bacterium]